MSSSKEAYPQCLYKVKYPYPHQGRVLTHSSYLRYDPILYKSLATLRTSTMPRSSSTALSLGDQIPILAGFVAYACIWIWVTLYLVSRAIRKWPRVELSRYPVILCSICCIVLALLWPLGLLLYIFRLCRNFYYKNEGQSCYFTYYDTEAGWPCRREPQPLTDRANDDYPCTIMSPPSGSSARFAETISEPPPAYVPYAAPIQARVFRA